MRGLQIPVPTIAAYRLLAHHTIHNYLQNLWRYLIAEQIDHVDEDPSVLTRQLSELTVLQAAELSGPADEDLVALCGIDAR